MPHTHLNSPVYHDSKNNIIDEWNHLPPPFTRPGAYFNNNDDALQGTGHDNADIEIKSIVYSIIP